MKITTRQTCIRTIKLNHPKFMITDGVVTSPRAGFEISEHCPASWKSLIVQAVEYGYIKPVAYMKDSELMWETLSDG